MKKSVYRVLENEEVVAIFKTKQYAQDFIDYEMTISDKEFILQSISLTDWLLESREF